VLVRISERIKDATATMAAPVITKFVHAILIIDCARSFFFVFFFLSSSYYSPLKQRVFMTRFERSNFHKNSLACLASIIPSGIN
jgi:hypothetical protein